MGFAVSGDEISGSHPLVPAPTIHTYVRQYPTFDPYSELSEPRWGQSRELMCVALTKFPTRSQKKKLSNTKTLR